MPTWTLAVLLLIGSSVTMTFARKGHFKERSRPPEVAIGVICGVGMLGKVD